MSYKVALFSGISHRSSIIAIVSTTLLLAGCRPQDQKPADSTNAGRDDPGDPQARMNGDQGMIPEVTSPASGWSDWASLGGSITQIAPALNADDRIEVFAIGTNTALTHIWQNFPRRDWSSW